MKKGINVWTLATLAAFKAAIFACIIFFGATPVAHEPCMAENCFMARQLPYRKSLDFGAMAFFVGLLWFNLDIHSHLLRLVFQSSKKQRIFVLVLAPIFVGVVWIITSSIQPELTIVGPI